MRLNFKVLTSYRLRANYHHKRLENIRVYSLDGVKIKTYKFETYLCSSSYLFIQKLYIVLFAFGKMNSYVWKVAKQQKDK